MLGPWYEQVWDTIVDSVEHPIDLLVNPGAVSERVAAKEIPEKTVVDAEELQRAYQRWDRYIETYEALKHKPPPEVEAYLKEQNRSSWAQALSDLRKGFFEFRGDLAKINAKFPKLFQQLHSYFGEDLIIDRSNWGKSEALDAFLDAEETTYAAYWNTINWKKNYLKQINEQTPGPIKVIVKGVTGVDISNPGLDQNGQPTSLLDLVTQLLKNFTGIDLNISTLGMYLGIGLIIFMIVIHFINKI